MASCRIVDSTLVDDFELMLERSLKAGVKSMIITGGSLSESKEALHLAKAHGKHHPPVRGSSS